MKRTIHFPNLIASTFMKTGSEMRSLGCYLVLYGISSPRRSSSFFLLQKCFLNIRTLLLTILRFHQLSPFNHILSFLLHFLNKNNIDERMRASYLRKMIEQIIAWEQEKTGGLYAPQNRNIVSKYNKNLGFMECKKKSWKQFHYPSILYTIDYKRIHSQNHYAM